MTCCFIGHKDTPQSLFPAVMFKIAELIDMGADTFYVGHNGAFDRMAYNTIRGRIELLNEKLNLNVVLAYIPKPGERPEYEYTVYPEELEKVPKRFAISKRNEWMIDRSDIVVCHVTKTFTNARKFRDYAIRKGKTIIDI